ncbi:MAG: hypothetical protein C5B49_08870 [Bdellovibrio sp.]|nr:MAG: hypothetical protein C5B49_08870 [Bdellovibrio sp.]
MAFSWLMPRLAIISLGGRSDRSKNGELTDVISEILSREIELRFVPDLWCLYDEVVESSLGFSIIRMRNAQPRDQVLEDKP